MLSHGTPGDPYGDPLRVLRAGKAFPWPARGSSASKESPTEPYERKGRSSADALRELPEGAQQSKWIVPHPKRVVAWT
ncbi:MAG: hypothetical protein D6812_03200 [Deltaproteobacteria bacterium]|nr:MAG: hypothetical protein D6812_03200 [Deltaproteobacteria bacterium]